MLSRGAGGTEPRPESPVIVTRSLGTRGRSFMTRRFLPALLIGILAAAPTAARAAEPWADRNLKVTQGLTLWLDATRLNAARAAAGLPPLTDGTPVETWPDASGQGLHLSQPDAAARPKFQDVDWYRAVRFDGEKTFLLHPQV